MTKPIPIRMGGYGKNDALQEPFQLQAFLYHQRRDRGLPHELQDVSTE